MNRALTSFFAAAVAASLIGCAAETSDDAEAGQDALSATSFTSKATAYYPDSSALEGGFVDRAGKPLKTLQQFLDGDADYVAVAMDTKAFAYGTRLRIRELDEKYGRPITFRVVDTGGAFRGRGRSRMDICVANEAASYERTVNSVVHVEVVTER